MTSPSLRLALAAVALWATAAPAPAMRQMAVVAYGSERGLSGHLVTAIAQDRHGRLWVGTWGGGAFRYDGLAFRSFTSRDGLLGDRVTALVAGAHGEMWVASAASPGSEGGLTVVQEERAVPIEGRGWRATTGLESRTGAVWLGLEAGGVARHFAGVLEPWAGIDGVEVRRIVESADGRLWFLGEAPGGDPTRPGTLHVLEKDRITRLGEADGVPVAPLRDLVADAAGEVWLATGRGLFRLERSRFVAVAAAGASLARPLHALSGDADGRLWAGADGAALVLDHGQVRELKLPPEMGQAAVLGVVAGPTGGVFLRTASHLMRLEGRSAEVLEVEERGPLLDAADDAELARLEARLDRIEDRNRPLLVDHEGGVWAILGRRIARYAGDEARRFGRDEGLPSEDVTAVLVSASGQVWAGTAAGLARMDPALGWFEPVAGLREPVRALFEDRGGTVYAAAGSGVYRPAGLDAVRWAPADLEEPAALAADAEGSLWIGGRGGVARVTADGLLRFGPRDGLAPSPVRALAAIDGELWVGHEAGLSRRKGSGFEVVPGFEDARVLAVLARRGEEGPTLFAATPGGLLSVPGAEPAFGRIERTLLAGAWIDRRGRLWQGLELGLLASSGGAEVLHAGGAFPAEPARAFAEDAAGRIWFATRRGLYRHSPRGGPPSVRIDEIRIGGEPAPGGEEVRAAGDCRHVEARFSGVSFIGPRDAADLRFETRLLPEERGWTGASSARSRSFAALRPGRYTFEVRAVSRDLLRSEPARVAIVVGRDDELPEPRRLELPEIAR